MEEFDLRRTAIRVWNERDRLHISLVYEGSEETIAEWWDEDAVNMFENGFFSPIGIGGDLSKLHSEALEYAISGGLYNPKLEKRLAFVEDCPHLKIYRRGDRLDLGNLEEAIAWTPTSLVISDLWRGSFWTSKSSPDSTGSLANYRWIEKHWSDRPGVYLSSREGLKDDYLAAIELQLLSDDMMAAISGLSEGGVFDPEIHQEVMNEVEDSDWDRWLRDAVEEAICEKLDLSEINGSPQSLFWEMAECNKVERSFNGLRVHWDIEKALEGLTLDDLAKHESH